MRVIVNRAAAARTSIGSASRSPGVSARDRADSPRAARATSSSWGALGPAPVVDAHREVVGEAAARGLLEVEDRRRSRPPAHSTLSRNRSPWMIPCVARRRIAARIACDRELLAEHGDRAGERRIDTVREPLVARDQVIVIVDAAAPPRRRQLEPDRVELARARHRAAAASAGVTSPAARCVPRSPREHADPLPGRTGQRAHTAGHRAP